MCPKSSSTLDESEIFWLSYKNFEPILTKKCYLFPEDTAESEFIALITDCVERNYGMFDLLYRSAAKFSSFDSYLCQIEKNINEEIIFFPNSTKFLEMKTVKEYFEETIINFLDDLIPAYELNEHLLNLVQSMNRKTKIDRQWLDKLSKEDEKIRPIWESFWVVFKTFSLDEYMQGLSEIRKTINRLEFDKIDLEEANIRLNISLPKLYRNAPTINDLLTAAWDIDFEALETSTKSFYSYVRKALKVDGASSSK